MEVLASKKTTQQNDEEEKEKHMRVNRTLPLSMIFPSTFFSHSLARSLTLFFSSFHVLFH